MSPTKALGTEVLLPLVGHSLTLMSEVPTTDSYAPVKVLGLDGETELTLTVKRSADTFQVKVGPNMWRGAVVEGGLLRIVR